MTKAITVLDMIDKLDQCVAHTQKAITKDDLKKIYMATRGHPIIGSEGTFNEKLRTFVSLELLKQNTRAGQVFTINWPLMDKLQIELREVD